MEYVVNVPATSLAGAMSDITYSIENMGQHIADVIAENVVEDMVVTSAKLIWANIISQGAVFSHPFPPVSSGSRRKRERKVRHCGARADPNSDQYLLFTGALKSTFNYSKGDLTSKRRIRSDCIDSIASTEIKKESTPMTKRYTIIASEFPYEILQNVRFKRVDFMDIPYSIWENRFIRDEINYMNNYLRTMLETVPLTRG